MIYVILIFKSNNQLIQVLIYVDDILVISSIDDIYSCDYR